MEERQLLQTIANAVYETNKAYERVELEKNKESYNAFRDALAGLQMLGVDAQVSETWEQGFVSLELNIKNVRY